MDLLPATFAFHDLQKTLSILVFVLAVIEVGCEAVDERLRHLELALVDFRFAFRRDALDRTYLVGEVHGLEQDQALAHT
ncbi:MAG TPA: hypothetical protein VES61_04925 [Gaiellaceae bacterium]|nr:hypothetical protein [Gaiellaceae bacterium]